MEGEGEGLMMLHETSGEEEEVVVVEGQMLEGVDLEEEVGEVGVEELEMNLDVIL